VDWWIGGRHGPWGAILDIAKARTSDHILPLAIRFKERLRGTVTRGIVSAFRRDRLTGLETIQADVSIQGGNSGGPLVDAQGNLVGLTVAAHVMAGSSASVGLNLFIPIGDALDRLRLEITDR
jgi:S1-C subfamily serine protease